MGRADSWYRAGCHRRRAHRDHFGRPAGLWFPGADDNASGTAVGVTGLEKTTAQEAGQTAGVADKLDLFGFFPGGDHVPFKEAGVPTVTIVSGGVHPHFHQPTDTADTINPEILHTVARYALALTWQLANVP